LSAQNIVKLLSPLDKPRLVANHQSGEVLCSLFIERRWCETPDILFFAKLSKKTSFVSTSSTTFETALYSRAF